MAKITVNDVRSAIAYGHDCGVMDLSDEELLQKDFGRDFGFGNIRLANVSIELQRRHNIVLPVEFFHEMKDNTVASFIESANKYLTD